MAIFFRPHGLRLRAFIATLGTLAAGLLVSGCAQLAAPPYHPGKTRCFLLDEPTSSLDLAHQSLVLAAIRRQARSGAAIVAVFHDLNLAAALADELVLLERGRAMAAGPASEVLRDDLLSAAYGCRVLTNRTPGDGKPFVLPPAIFPASTASDISEDRKAGMQRLLH